MLSNTLDIDSKASELKSPWMDDRLAANGRPVQENFSAWFLASKVLDSNGCPLSLFHGTHGNIEAFDKKRIGQNFAADAEGFFFTSCARTASEYTTDSSGKEKDGANVLKVFVSIQRALIIDDAFLASENMAPIGKSHDAIDFWDNYQGLILDWVDERKSDGVMLVDRLTVKNDLEPMRMVVAFDARQIKSALGNSGLYDRRSTSLTDSQSSFALERANQAKLAIKKAMSTTLKARP